MGIMAAIDLRVTFTTFPSIIRISSQYTVFSLRMQKYKNEYTIVLYVVAIFRIEHMTALLSDCKQY